MSDSAKCFVWNVRGLNGCARRSVVRDLLILHRPSLVCLQQTKIADFCNVLTNETLGPAFDYAVLPAINAAGGLLFAWVRDSWVVTVIEVGVFSISVCLRAVGSQDHWLITAVYGPQEDADKITFLAELTQF
jgi:hypothetical protein